MGNIDVGFHSAYILNYIIQIYAFGDSHDFLLFVFVPILLLLSSKKGQLIRYIWYMLDRAQDSTPFEVVVLDGVKQFEFRYLDAQQEWQSSWPNELGPNPDKSPPRAVEVIVETEEFGQIKRKFRVPGA